MDQGTIVKSILGFARRSRKEALHVMRVLTGRGQSHPWHLSTCLTGQKAKVPDGRASTHPTEAEFSPGLRSGWAVPIVAALVGVVWLPRGVVHGAELASAAATILAGDAGRHVAALADDAFEGREAGTRGGRAAGSYIVEAIDHLGLEPAGDAGGWYQPFGSMRNILALARGSDPTVAEELVVVSAHYDHVGYGNASNSYGPFGFVHNGADDNASGVAGLIEIAEAIQALPSHPRRSILLAFWDGEEKGLLGSSHFLRVRPGPLRDFRIVFCINLDMIGRLRGERVEVYGSRTAPGLRALTVGVNNRPGTRALELAYDWKIDPDSDHYSFIEKRIPTLMFHTGLHDNYHRPSDDVHLVNLDGLEPVARLTFATAIAVADDPAVPRTFRSECRQESESSRRMLEALAAGGKRGRWGIGSRSDPAEVQTPVVVRVAPESPAARGGLIVGDRIVMIDGVPLMSQDDMVRRLGESADRVSVLVDRRGRLVQLELATQ